MSKFCGNCGTKLSDKENKCSNCGTSFDVNPKLEKKAKIKRKFKLFVSLIVILVLAIFSVKISSGFIGYKGTVRKIMNAYENYDVDNIISMTSEIYYCMDDQNYVENYFADFIYKDFDNFENQVGHKYKISYEIIDSYEMSVHKYEALLDELSGYIDFDADIITKVMVVDIAVTAKEGKESFTRDLQLTLSKENKSWKLFNMK